MLDFQYDSDGFLIGYCKVFMVEGDENHDISDFFNIDNQ